MSARVPVCTFDHNHTKDFPDNFGKDWTSQFFFNVLEKLPHDDSPVTWENGSEYALEVFQVTRVSSVQCHATPNQRVFTHSIARPCAYIALIYQTRFIDRQLVPRLDQYLPTPL